MIRSINIGIRANIRREGLYENTPVVNSIVTADILSYTLLINSVIVPQAGHIVAEPTTISYSINQFDATVTIIHITVPVDLIGYAVTDYAATAFQRISVSSLITLENYLVDLYDVTITTQIVVLPNLVPMADVSNGGGWTTAPLWSKVNTPGSSATFITSSNANGSTCRLRFTTPTMGSAAVLRLYRRKTTGNDPAFIWTLFRDGVQVQTNSLTLTNTVFTQTDYPLDQNLVAGAVYEVELTRSGGGSPAQRGVVDMAAIWIDPV